MTGRIPLAQPLTLDFNLVEVRNPERGRDLLGVPARSDLAATQSDVGSLRTRLSALEKTVQSWPAPSTVGHVPVGCVVAYLKNLSTVPALPVEFAECNGQTLADPASPFNRQVLPNLNGASAGTKRFLRGSTTSGTTGGADTHSHSLSTASISTYSGATLVATGSSTVSSSFLPSYYEVVWVLRVR
jgi:hypothetical protein